MSEEWEIVRGKDNIDKAIKEETNKIFREEENKKNNTINEDKASNFDKRGKFLPGNQIGKIQKKKAYNVDELRRAIEDVEKGEKNTLLKHFIRKAYTSEQVLIALIKKLVPDISITELNNSGSPFNLFVTQFLQEKKQKEIEKEINERPVKQRRKEHWAETFTRYDKKEKEINERPKPETLINKGENRSTPSGE